MTRTLADDLADQFRENMLGATVANGIEESLVYRPRLGGTRAITGWVRRDQNELLPETPAARTPLLRIWLLNNATTGISSGEFDNGDRIDVAINRGGTAEPRPIVRMVNQNATYIEIEVR